MNLYNRYNLTPVINARGTFTPLGVSRSSTITAEAAAAALQSFFIITELQQRASEAISAWCGAPAGAVTHCVASAITLSISAVRTGLDPERIATAPNLPQVPNKVVLPAGHAVNYGHEIIQDIHLAGAEAVLAGNENGCESRDLESALDDPQVICLLLVSSRLTRGHGPDFNQAVKLAHARGLPVIIDGAAQDMRVEDLLACGADCVLVSAHKYLASPTAGLIIGKRDMVTATLAQEKGIGRAMKASKEAIIGVLAAIDERLELDIGLWRCEQDHKLKTLADRVGVIAGLTAQTLVDPVGMPFARLAIDVDANGYGRDAGELASALRDGTPPIYLMEDRLEEGRLVLELVPLTIGEIDCIGDRLEELADGY